MPALMETDSSLVSAPMSPTSDENRFVNVDNVQNGDASQFWQKQVENLESTVFPTLPSPSHVPSPEARAELQVKLDLSTRYQHGMTAVVRAAWAILLARYTQSSDVVFGSVTEQRPGANAKISAPADVMFTRVLMDPDTTVVELIELLQNQERAMRPYQHIGLENIKKLGSNAEAACNFQNILLVRPTPGVDNHRQDSPLESPPEDGAFPSCGNRALLLECQFANESAILRARYDPDVICAKRMDRVLQQLGHALAQVCQQENQATPVDLLELAGPHDLQDLRRWNAMVPDAVEACVHELISQTAQRRPEAPAVCAWDGELSYGELDSLSSRLSYRLADAGVRREMMVPLCFEKSLWTPVAMLAVMKAGGAFVLLDPSHPDNRLRFICENLRATVAIASPGNTPRLSSIVSTTLTLDPSSAKELPNVQSVGISKSLPSDAAYVIFTSGSTGDPKGCKIEHRSYASAALTHGPVMQICSSTRSLQFGSYSFAGAIMETLMPLIHGGCVCVPSEEQRRTGLAAAVQSLQANWAFLTPTVLAYLTPKEVPSLKTICIGGEPIRSSQIQQWSGCVHLRQTYGSAETSAVVSSANINKRSKPSDVGKASTAHYWIVDEANHDRLMPVGATGEVLIEGPVIGREYVGLLEKTAATFIAAPSWRTGLGPSKAGWRFYKTGDMATLSADGALELQGRKDTQVKLRGQRIELGEIEHQARGAHRLLKECVVELVRPHGGSSGPGSGAAILVAFLVLNKAETAGGQADQAGTAIDALRSKLESALPQYMVPSAFMPLQELPLTVTGKMNRRRLREIGSELTTEQLLAAGRAAQPEPNGKLSTPGEKQLRDIWASVLAIEPESIGPNSNFMRMGGDSLEAMWLVAEAREQGLVLTVADVFRHPSLGDLALCLKPQAA